MIDNNSIKNGIGMSYRALEADILELERGYYGGLVRLTKAEIRNKLDGLDQIVSKTKEMRSILEKYSKVALTEEEEKEYEQKMVKRQTNS